MTDFYTAIQAIKEDRIRQQSQIKSLQADFGFVPFNVINRYSKQFKSLGKLYADIPKATGRKGGLTGKSTPYTMNGKLSGTSRFSPALAHILLTWFAKPGDVIFDPFCGSAERGCVAQRLELIYTGIDIREEQIIANQRYAPYINWICLDSEDVDMSADILFTCPPYWNMEKYSQLEGDLSNQPTYDLFINKLAKILLKPDIRKFVILVVGDIRQGRFILPFQEDVLSFMAQKYFLLNRVQIIGNASAHLRARRAMEKSQILTNVVQTALVFVPKDYYENN